MVEFYGTLALKIGNFTKDEQLIATIHEQLEQAQDIIKQEESGSRKDGQKNREDIGDEIKALFSQVMCSAKIDYKTSGFEALDWVKVQKMFREEFYDKQSYQVTAFQESPTDGRPFDKFKEALAAGRTCLRTEDCYQAIEFYRRAIALVGLITQNNETRNRILKVIDIQIASIQAFQETDKEKVVVTKSEFDEDKSYASEERLVTLHVRKHAYEESLKIHSDWSVKELIHSIYEICKKTGKYLEDLRNPIPKKVCASEQGDYLFGERGYEGTPDLRGEQRVSLRIGERVVSFKADGPTKLGQIREFLWDLPDQSPQIQVSFWQNTLKNHLLDCFREQIRNSHINVEFILKVEKEFEENGLA